MPQATTAVARLCTIGQYTEMNCVKLKFILSIVILSLLNSTVQATVCLKWIEKDPQDTCQSEANPDPSGMMRFTEKIFCNTPAGKCQGCGCHGGPGYRSISTGKCVSFKSLRSECGDPPTLRCVFENAPGTGDNKECALSH